MTGFISKRINRERKLGGRLKCLREEHSVAIDKLSAALHIPKKYLEDLEAGRYQNLPEEIYVRNFIRSYAQIFGRDSAPFLDLYELELSAARPFRKKECLVPAPGLKKRDLLPLVLIFRVALAGIIGLSLLFYLGYEVKKITSPPSLAILEPEDNAVTKTGEITVRGKSEPESQIKINGEETLADEDGNFKETVRLQRGLNIIKISASKRRSKERVIFRRVVYEEALVTR